MITQLKQRDSEYRNVQKQFLRDKYPKLSEQWNNYTVIDKHKDNIEGLKTIKEF